MKSLHTLIRLHQRKVDDLRRQIGALENEKQKMLDSSSALERELKDEQALAAKTPELGGFFGDFAGRIRTRQAEIAKEVYKLEKKLADLAEQARNAFGELKRFEILRERRQEEARQAENRREGLQLDEIAAIRHRRKDQGGVT